MRTKVTVVGAGNVGATCAQEIARRDYADVVLVDIIPNFPQGKALDMNQAGSVLDYEPRIVGTNGYDETADSEVVVITAGRPRAPGMSRDDLVSTNEAIVTAVTKEAVKRSPKAILVIVSNPLKSALLDVETEWARLSAGLEAVVKAGQLTIERLRTATGYAERTVTGALRELDAVASGYAPKTWTLPDGEQRQEAFGQ